MKKYNLIICRVLICSSCSWIGAGTLGSFKEYYFVISEQNFNKELLKFYKQNSIYSIPEKYIYLDNWDEGGYGFLKGKILYFKNEPEEMYFVSYYELDKENTVKQGHKSINFSVRAVNDCKSSRWDTEQDYDKDKKEQERIEKRFYDEIIVKLEKQLHTKAIEDNSWF